MAVQTYKINSNDRGLLNQFRSMEGTSGISGADKYAGYDFRGNPISQSNIGQYLIDYATYQKAINDFGISGRPYWVGRNGQIQYTPSVVASTQTPLNEAKPKGFEISGDFQGASNFLRSQGITNFNFAPSIGTTSTNIGAQGFSITGGIADNPTNSGRSAFGSQLASIIFGQNPEMAGNPNLVSQVISSRPDLISNSWNWVNSNAQQAFKKEQSKDKGGFGVVAEGLGQVAQFAGLASGLHGLTAGLGAITSGAGLSGAFNAGMNAAGSIANIGDVVGGIVGNPAIGNLANVGVGGITGGYEGGVPGALIGAGGAAIGAGVDYAGGVGEFVRNPLEALGGAFDVVGGAGTNVTGLLNDMGDVAQIGPGSLAANTPTPGLNLGGPTVMSTDIPMESVLVTAVMPDDSISAGGWLASTLINAGIPVRDNITYYADANGNLAGWFDPSSTDITIRPPVSIPPDTVAGAPVNQPEPSTGQTDAGTQASTGSSSTGQTGTSGTQTGGGAAVGAGTGAVTGLLDPSTGGTTGSVPVGGGSTTSGAGLLDQNVTPVDQTVTGGAGSTGGATGAVTGGTTGAGGTTGGTAGGVTAGTTGGTPGIEFGSPAHWDAIYANAPRPLVNTGQPPAQQPENIPERASPQAISTALMNQIRQTLSGSASQEALSNPVNSWANSGTGQVQNFATPQPQVPTTPQLGSQEWLNQVLATQATTTPMLPQNPINSWANSDITGQVKDFATPQSPVPPEISSQEFINAMLSGIAGAGFGGSAELINPVNSWAFSGTGIPQDFVTPGVAGGGGIGLDAGTTPGTEFGAGFGDATGSGIGTGDSTGPGMGAGTGPGAGGLLTEPAPIVDQAVQATNNPLDFGLPDLSMFGGSQGGLGEATGSGIYGGKMGGFEGKYPKTPKKKKRGITVQIAGARRNA